MSSDSYKTFITTEKYKVCMDEKQSAMCCYYPKQSVRCTYCCFKSLIPNSGKRGLKNNVNYEKVKFWDSCLKERMIYNLSKESKAALLQCNWKLLHHRESTYTASRENDYLSFPMVRGCTWVDKPAHWWGGWGAKGLITDLVGLLCGTAAGFFSSFLLH